MGESRLVECAASGLPRLVDRDMRSFAGFLTIVEKDFNCAGVCSKSDFYLFTDVNRGIPEESCKRAIGLQLGTYAHPKGWSMIMIGLLGLCGTLFAICVYNARRRKKFMPLFAYNSSAYWRSLALENKGQQEEE